MRKLMPVQMNVELVKRRQHVDMDERALQSGDIVSLKGFGGLLKRKMGAMMSTVVYPK